MGGNLQRRIYTVFPFVVTFFLFLFLFVNPFSDRKFRSRHWDVGRGGGQILFYSEFAGAVLSTLPRGSVPGIHERGEGRQRPSRSH